MPKYKKYKTQRRYKVKRKKSILKSRFFWYPLLGIIFFSAVFYFLFFSYFFQVEGVEVKGNIKVDGKEIRNIISEYCNKKIFFLNTRSIFLVSPNEIDNVLKERFPRIYQINLKRDFPNAVFAEVEERTALADFCFEEKCFHVGREGIAFEEKDKETGIKVVVPNDFSLRDKVIDPEKLEGIVAVKNDLDGVEITEFILEGKLTVKTSEGWEIYFDLDKDVSEQIFNLELVLKEKILPELRENLEYIDLRFENRVFVSPPLVDVVDEN